jgi:hypothetical protein
MSGFVEPAQKYFNQLNPQERRIVVIVFLAVFLVLNIFFVWPHYGDLARDKILIKKATDTLALFQNELKNSRGYQNKIRDLENEGSPVLPEEQAINFDRFFREKAANANVPVLSASRMTTKTNEFFLDQEVGVTVQAPEKPLVEFLYSLGEGSSMVRVRAMSLRPDPSHQQLNASVTMVASYQKKAPARVAVSAKASAAAAPTTTPAASTPKAPAEAAAAKGGLHPPGAITNRFTRTGLNAATNPAVSSNPGLKTLKPPKATQP